MPFFAKKKDNPLMVSGNFLTFAAELENVMGETLSYMKKQNFSNSKLI